MFRKSVLIIDDDAALAAAYCDLLVEEGFDASYVIGGAAALAHLAKAPAPTLILLDFKMPGMSGEEFLGALREKQPAVFTESRIVGFSSFAPDLPWLDGFRGQVYRIVEKPYDLDRFTMIVKSFVAA